MIQCFVLINVREIVQGRGREDKGHIAQLLDVFTKLLCSLFYSQNQEVICSTKG